MTRVLVADDNEDICLVLKMNLELEGYQVTLARDGNEARHLALSDPPDMILLDGMMPGIDGVDLLVQLKANPATAEVPVIMLSARTADSNVWAGWKAGAACYLTKPLEIRELLRYMTLLDGHEPIGPSEPPQSDLARVLDTLESYQALPI